MQRSLEYYFKGESSGVAAVSGSSSGLQKREKEKVMINVLFTKRRSIIAPKSRDNYPYILNVRHLIIIFWLFNSKLYGISKPSGTSGRFLLPDDTNSVILDLAAMAEQGPLLHLLLLLLGLGLAVNSQSYPRFMFKGDVLVNNSYIHRGHIGEGHNDSLHCVTDNSDCCSNGEGDWYNETGGEVQQGSLVDSDRRVYVTRGTGVVYLNRRIGGTSGMWRCDIPDSNGAAEQSIYIYLGTPMKGV